MRSLDALVEDQIVIELATVEDAAQLAQTGAALFVQTFADANRAADMASYLESAFSEARQRREIADERNRIWLARGEQGVLVGYAHVRLRAAPPIEAREVATAEIARLYTDRSLHGRGLGSALMAVCIATAREYGAQRLWLGVWEHNARAIAFYAKHGFSVIGDQPFTLGADRQRDLVMALDLTTPP